VTAARVGRVHDRESFLALRRAGRRGRSDGVSATWCPADDGSVRLALAVNRAVGGAVVRNRLRRQLRAAFGGLAAQVPPGTYLLGGGSSAVGLAPEVLRGHLRDALVRAGAGAR